MDNEMQNEGPELQDMLNQEWSQMAKNQKATMEFIQTSVKRKVEGSQTGYTMVAFFN